MALAAPSPFDELAPNMRAHEAALSRRIAQDTSTVKEELQAELDAVALVIALAEAARGNASREAALLAQLGSVESPAYESIEEIWS